MAMLDYNRYTCYKAVDYQSTLSLSWFCLARCAIRFEKSDFRNSIYEVCTAFSQSTLSWPNIGSLGNVQVDANLIDLSIYTASCSEYCN
jgi:hypothetical protein